MHASWIAAGALTWAAHFALVYGITALACARGVPHAIPWAIALVGLAAVAATFAILQRSRRERATFIGWMTAASAGLALVAVVYESLPVIFLPICR